VTDNHHLPLGERFVLGLSSTVATSQLGTPLLPAFPFAGPCSLSVLDQGSGKFEASIEKLQLQQIQRDWEAAGRRCVGERSDTSPGAGTQRPMTPKRAGLGHDRTNGTAREDFPDHQTSRLPPIESFGKAISSSRDYADDSTSLNSYQAATGMPQITPSPTMHPHALPRPSRMPDILNPPSNDSQRLPSPTELPRLEPSGGASTRSTPDSPPESLTGSANGRPLLPVKPYPHFSESGNRPVLAPVLSINRRGNMGPIPPATIDAKQSPFLPSKSYNVGLEASLGSRSGTPRAMSPPLIGRQPSYGFPPHPPVPPMNATRPEQPQPQQPPPQPQSQGASPATSYSSYSHTSRTSPASHFSMPPAQPQYYASGPAASEPIIAGPANGYGSNYQMMTIDTGSGPMQVAVDVQAASKMADEKRKRNAGASARFRMRRKEKEKESSQTISKLETQLRDMTEARDFYRQERDYFRNMAYQNGQAQLTPRMASPIARSLSIESEVSSEWQQIGERGSEEGRNLRRRSLIYDTAQESAHQAQQRQQPQPPLPPLAPPPVPMQQQQQGYAPTNGVNGNHSQPPLQTRDGRRISQESRPLYEQSGQQQQQQQQSNGYERHYPQARQ
jgi:hypothetical protein